MKRAKILISQPEPTNANPYTELISKYGLKIDFHQLFKIEALTAKDFRLQKINILDHTAIVFTAKSSIDAFFSICEEMRIVVPETMKYFCTSEAVALYLQKHIVYRKRKIFFGNGTIESIIDAIGTKHKTETFLISTVDNAKSEIVKLFTKAKLKNSTAFFCKTIFSDLSQINIRDYDMLVFYSPSDVKSLLDNYPDFEQGSLKIATFGTLTAKAVKAAKLQIEVLAPTPEAPSIAKALMLYCAK